MGNSNTEHSKKLRIKTSSSWQKDNQKRLYLTFVNKDWDLIDKFNQVPGNTMVEKFRLLINNYYKNE